jgi:hypothetical protein
LSFFDEDDEPRRSPRPRRGTSATAGAPDTQTLLVRRAVALGGGLLILLLLVFVVRGCLESRKETALKDYNRDVTAIATDSSRQIGVEFFRLLGEGGNESPQDLQTAISGFRVQAEQQLKQAQGLDVPDEMAGAHQSLLIALEARRDGLDYVAQRIRTALGDSGEAADRAINQIAGQMQVFLASDVTYRTRVVPFIENALDENEIGGQEIVASQFLPSLAWLQPETVAGQLDQQLSPGAGRDRNEPTGPGLHGTNIDAVLYGDSQLQPETPNQLTYDPETPFLVRFTNGGENDEFDVRVSIRVTAGQGGGVTGADTIEQIAPQQSAEASIVLDEPPPVGQAVTVRVRIAPVPGEEKTDNNQAEFNALFQQG